MKPTKTIKDPEALTLNATAKKKRESTGDISIVT